MSCTHNFNRFCSVIAAPDSAVTQALGGDEVGPEVLKRLQQLVRNRAERDGVTGSSRLLTIADAVREHQRLVAAGKAELAAALNDTLQLFKRMRQLNIKPPTHKNTVPVAHAAWHGYAAVERTLQAIEAQQALPEDAQQVLAALQTRGQSSPPLSQIAPALVQEEGGADHCPQCGQFVGNDGTHVCPRSGLPAGILPRSPSERLADLATLAENLAETIWNSVSQAVSENSRGDEAADLAILDEERATLDPLRAEIKALRATDDQPTAVRLARLAEIARELRRRQDADELMDIAEWTPDASQAEEETQVSLCSQATDMHIARLEQGYVVHPIDRAESLLTQARSINDPWTRQYILQMLIPGLPDALKGDVVAQSLSLPTRVGGRAAVMPLLVARWPADGSLIPAAIDAVLAIEFPTMIPDHLRQLLPHLDEAQRHELRTKAEQLTDERARAVVLDVLVQSSSSDQTTAGQCPACGEFMAAEGSHVCPSAASASSGPPTLDGRTVPVHSGRSPLIDEAQLLQLTNGRIDWQEPNTFQLVSDAADTIRVTSDRGDAWTQAAEACQVAVDAWQITDLPERRLRAADAIQAFASVQAEAAGLDRCQQCGQFVGRAAHACPGTPPVSAAIFAVADWILTYAPILGQLTDARINVADEALVGDAITMCEELIVWLDERDDVPPPLSAVLADLRRETIQSRRTNSESHAIFPVARVLRELRSGLPTPPDWDWLTESPSAVAQFLREVPGIRAIADGGVVDERPHWLVPHPLEHVAHLLRERVARGYLKDVPAPSLAAAAQQVVDTCVFYREIGYSLEQKAALRSLAQELVATAELERLPANGYTTPDGLDADDVEPFDAEGYAATALFEVPSLLQIANGYHSLGDGLHAEAEQARLDGTAMSLQQLALLRSETTWSPIVEAYVRHRRSGTELEQRRSATQMAALLAELAGLKQCPTCGEFLARAGGHVCRAFNGTQPIDGIEGLRRVIQTAFPPSSRGVPEVRHFDGRISIQLPQADGTFVEISGPFVPTVYAEIQDEFDKRWANRGQDADQAKATAAQIAWGATEHVLASYTRRLEQLHADQASRTGVLSNGAPANTPFWFHETALLALDATGENLVALANRETTVSRLEHVMEDADGSVPVTDWMLSVAQALVRTRSEGAGIANSEAGRVGPLARSAARNYLQQPDDRSAQDLARVIVRAAGRSQCPMCGRFQSADGAHACPVRDVLLQVPSLYQAATEADVTLDPEQVALVGSVAEHLLQPGVPQRLRSAAEHVITTGTVDLAAVPEFARQLIDEVAVRSAGAGPVDAPRPPAERFQHIEARTSAALAYVEARRGQLDDEQQRQYDLLVHLFETYRSGGVDDPAYETNWSALARTVAFFQWDVEGDADVGTVAHMRQRADRMVIEALFGNGGWVDMSDLALLDQGVIRSDAPGQSALAVLETVAPYLGSTTQALAFRLARTVAPEDQAKAWALLLTRWPDHPAIGAAFMHSLAAYSANEQGQLLRMVVDVLPVADIPAAWWMATVAADFESQAALVQRATALGLSRCPACGEFQSLSGAHSCPIFTATEPIQSLHSLRRVIDTAFPVGSDGRPEVTQTDDQILLRLPQEDGSYQELVAPASPATYAEIQAEFDRRVAMLDQDERQSAQHAAQLAWRSLQYVVDQHTRRREMRERGVASDTALWLHESARQALEVVGDRLVALANSETLPTAEDRAAYTDAGDFSTAGAWLGNLARLMVGTAAYATPQERREPVSPRYWQAAQYFLQQPDDPEARDLARVLLQAAGVAHCAVCGRFQSADGSHACVAHDLFREVPDLRRVATGTVVFLTPEQEAIVQHAAEQLLLPGVAPRLKMVATDLLSADGLNPLAEYPFAKQLLEERQILAGADVVDAERSRDERIQLIRDRISEDLDALELRYRDLTEPQQRRCDALAQRFAELGDREYLGTGNDPDWGVLAGDFALLWRDIEEIDEIDLGRRSVAEVRWWAANAAVDCLLHAPGWISRSDFLALDALVVRSDDPPSAAVAVLERVTAHLGSGCQPLALRLIRMVPRAQQANISARLFMRWPDDAEMASAFMGSLMTEPTRQQHRLLQLTANILPVAQLERAWRIAVGVADPAVPMAVEQRAAQLGVQRCPACGRFVSSTTAHLCPQGVLHEPLTSEERWAALIDLFDQEGGILVASDLDPALLPLRTAIQLSVVKLRQIRPHERTPEHFARLAAELQRLVTMRLAATHRGADQYSLQLQQHALYARIEALGYGTGWLNQDRVREIWAQADQRPATLMERLNILQVLLPVLPDSCYPDVLRVMAPVASTPEAVRVWMMMARRWPHDTSNVRFMLNAIQSLDTTIAQVGFLSALLPQIPAAHLDDVAMLVNELDHPGLWDRFNARAAELSHDRCVECGRFVSTTGSHMCSGEREVDLDLPWATATAMLVMPQFDQLLLTANTGARGGDVLSQVALLLRDMDQVSELPSIVREAAADYLALLDEQYPTNSVQRHQAFCMVVLNALGVPHCPRCGQFTARDHTCPITEALLRVPELRDWATGTVAVDGDTAFRQAGKFVSVLGLLKNAPAAAPELRAAILDFRQFMASDRLDTTAVAPFAQAVIAASEHRSRIPRMTVVDRAVLPALEQAARQPNLLDYANGVIGLDDATNHALIPLVDMIQRVSEVGLAIPPSVHPVWVAYRSEAAHPDTPRRLVQAVLDATGVAHCQQCGQFLPADGQHGCQVQRVLVAVPLLSVADGQALGEPQRSVLEQAARTLCNAPYIPNSLKDAARAWLDVAHQPTGTDSDERLQRFAKRLLGFAQSQPASTGDGVSGSAVLVQYMSDSGLLDLANGQGGAINAVPRLGLLATWLSQQPEPISGGSMMSLQSLAKRWVQVRPVPSQGRSSLAPKHIDLALQLVREAARVAQFTHCPTCGWFISPLRSHTCRVQQAIDAVPLEAVVADDAVTLTHRQINELRAAAMTLSRSPHIPDGFRERAETFGNAAMQAAQRGNLAMTLDRTLLRSFARDLLLHTGWMPGHPRVRAVLNRLFPDGDGWLSYANGTAQPTPELVLQHWVAAGAILEVADGTDVPESLVRAALAVRHTWREAPAPDQVMRHDLHVVTSFMDTLAATTGHERCSTCGQFVAATGAHSCPSRVAALAATTFKGNWELLDVADGAGAVSATQATTLQEVAWLLDLLATTQSTLQGDERRTDAPKEPSAEQRMGLTDDLVAAGQALLATRDEPVTTAVRQDAMRTFIRELAQAARDDHPRENGLDDRTAAGAPGKPLPHHWQEHWAEQDRQMRLQIETLTGMAQVRALWNIQDDQARANALTELAYRLPSTCGLELTALVQSCAAPDVGDAQSDAYDALEAAGCLHWRIPSRIARPLSERLLSFARNDLIALANGTGAAPTVLRMLREATPHICSQQGVMEQLAQHDRPMHDALRAMTAPATSWEQPGQMLARLVCERADVARCERCHSFLVGGHHDCPATKLHERRWSRVVIGAHIEACITAANERIVSDELRPVLRRAARAIIVPGAPASAVRAAAQALVDGTDSGHLFAGALCHQAAVPTCTACGAFVQNPTSSTCSSCTP